MTRHANGSGAPLTVGLVGAGMMGVSLAHLSGRAGLDTVLKVRGSPGAVERGEAALRASFAREVAAGRATPDEARAGEARVRVTDDLADLTACGIVVECVPEQLGLKHRVLREIESSVGPDCVIASNTSSYRIADLARPLARPDRVAAMHYFWPAHRKPLVEIAGHEGTDHEALARARELARRQGVHELLVAGTPGFLTTRLIFAFFSESIRLAEQGMPFEFVDQSLESFGWPMGPFRLMDWLGLENMAHIHDSLRPVMQDRVGGTRRLWDLVEAGFPGRRGDAGFYLYGDGTPRPNPKTWELIYPGVPSRVPLDEVWRRPVYVLIGEAAHCVAEGVVSGWAGADLGATLGLGFPSKQGGLLGYLNRVGLPALREALEAWERQYGDRFHSAWQETLVLETR